MRRARWNRRAALALLVLGLPAPARAQVTTLNGLAFGTVITGTSTTVAVTSASAAQWQIHVTILSALGTFSLALPTQLVRSGGAQTMPVSFCATCGRWRQNSNAVGGATTFNPASTVSFSSLPAGTNIFVWLGGTVTPPLNQVAGTYLGTVVLVTTGLTL